MSAANRNGQQHAHQLSDYIPPQGRPPRKPREEVRTNLRNVRRTINEAVSLWEETVVLNSDRTDYEIINAETVQMVAGLLSLADARLKAAREGVNALVDLVDVRAEKHAHARSNGHKRKATPAKKHVRRGKKRSASKKSSADVTATAGE